MYPVRSQRGRCRFDARVRSVSKIGERVDLAMIVVPEDAVVEVRMTAPILA